MSEQVNTPDFVAAETVTFTGVPVGEQLRSAREARGSIFWILHRRSSLVRVRLRRWKAATGKVCRGIRSSEGSFAITPA